MMGLLKMMLSRMIAPFTHTLQPSAPTGYRGTIEYDPAACIGCGLCVRFCPSRTINMKPNRKIALNLAECCYCGTCEEVCPVKCIKLTTGYSTGTTDRKSKELVVQ
jgi:formate hydrogenlyase subunit 6/NADH:ubiquinone oxidoreductase subunit I